MRDCLEHLASLIGDRQIAEQVLKHTTLAHLASASLPELQSFMPEHSAKTVHAALRLGRASLVPRNDSNPLDSSAAAFEHVCPILAGLEVERTVVLCLNATLRLLHTEVTAQGGANQVSMRPCDVFAPAVRHRASAIILAHNHPSGNPDPSNADKVTTMRVRAAAQIIGIPLLDHLVIGSASSFVSFRDTWWPDLEDDE